jgi:hypothetical protein
MFALSARKGKNNSLEPKKDKDFIYFGVFTAIFTQVPLLNFD